MKHDQIHELVDADLLYLTVTRNIIQTLAVTIHNKNTAEESHQQYEAL